MFLETLGRNKFGINTYILADDKKNAVVIDPGINYESIVYSLKENQLNVKAILLTHGHCDHIADVQKIKEKFDIPVYCHIKDNELLMHAKYNYSKDFGMGSIEFSADVLVKDGESINLDELDLKVIHTPGHTKGGVCYMYKEILFTGDTLFAGSMGRTDLYGGNEEHMAASLRKLSQLSDNITIYPGHGPKSTIKIEKETNPFLRL
ncbi:MBL fold metallo-hydrolase [Proteocatella sphenisci]|uniref:MBL fold metallo-hydrolase n=1 Tax=Proteocatella sphenisci TaxID=181070 RepID=UPI00048F02D0|nr:MBL fold metallo-hydrolase [Proteocatella sphenisci]